MPHSTHEIPQRKYILSDKIKFVDNLWIGGLEYYEARATQARGTNMKNILVALDFSDVTPIVLGRAAAMATAFEADLHLVHTMDPGPNYAIYGFGPAEFPDPPLADRARAASDAKLAELAGSTGLPPQRVHTATVTALPVEGILKHAREIGADLLVVGSHGHGFIGSVLVGSVAQGIVRRAELPTLVVPRGK
jgi:nucleotide-binding universal stress UspA family protein